MVDLTKTAAMLCAAGYHTRSVRPPSSYTNDLKRRQIVEYGYADTDPAHYEEDHLVPLELGGDPTDPRNLWPEPRLGLPEESASAKDYVENQLHRDVCAGDITLGHAQHAIALNWRTALE